MKIISQTKGHIVFRPETLEEGVLVDIWIGWKHVAISRSPQPTNVANPWLGSGYMQQAINPNMGVSP